MEKIFAFLMLFWLFVFWFVFVALTATYFIDKHADKTGVNTPENK